MCFNVISDILLNKTKKDKDEAKVYYAHPPFVHSPRHQVPHYIPHFVFKLYTVNQ